ncbi:MAG: DNA polymerase III subunit gamma/tau [Eubacterium sp.]|nr:DNA polymerase III subunit gamma/tau [Eubacterium sp.]
MSYIALYRKFRPKTFDEVRGQDATVTTLRNQLTSGRIGHAYLFCGTRGTGKTSVAKIMGRALNCRNPVNGSPCCECESCKAIEEGKSLNVIEIDAASNNGVDDVRRIREEVAYPPTDGNYKVYIIDEVHMLSTPAFNALLKTLEEPPSYVIFILATTELHKIPVTILSRCQRYDFHRITADVIEGHLKDLLEQEGTEYEDKAVSYIARAADGAMRDALSLMDQCLAFYMNEPLTYEHVLEVLGTVDFSVYQEMMGCVLDEDVAGLLSRFDAVVRSGRDLSEFVEEFIGYLRNLMLVKTDADVVDLIDLSPENLSVLLTYANRITLERVTYIIKIFSSLSGDIRYVNNKRIPVEAALIKLCRPQMDATDEGFISRLESIEKKLEAMELVDIKRLQQTGGAPGLAANAATGNSPNATDSVQAGPAREPAANAAPPVVIDLPPAVKEDLEKVAAQWDSIVMKMPISVRGLFGSVRPLVNEAGLTLSCEVPMTFEHLKKEERLKMIEDIIAESVGKQVKVIIADGSTKSGGDRYMELASLINMKIEVDETI